MLNKHTKPYDEKKMRKKIRKMTTPKPTLPPPTTKRTAELQPKVPFIYYVSACWGGEGVRKWQLLLISVLKYADCCCRRRNRRFQKSLKMCLHNI